MQPTMTNHHDDVLMALAEHGLRCDMNPTHDMSSLDASETFWHRYLRMLDANVRQLATNALEAAPSPPAGLVNALRMQQQCDEDGTMCMVSRQAVDEAAAIIEKLQASPPDSSQGEPVAWLYRVDNDEPPCYKVCRLQPSNRRVANAFPVYAAPQSAPKAAEPQWEPIETAPKDGTKILVLPNIENADHPVIAQWRDDKYSKNPRPYFCWDWFRVGSQRETQPLIWQQLPAPPEKRARSLAQAEQAK